MKLLLPYRLDDELQYESVWVDPVSTGYRLNSILFLAKGIAFRDIVAAIEEDGALYFEDLVETSGHSTIRILFWKWDKEVIDSTTEELIKLGCDWEGSHIPTLIAVDVPPTVNYTVVKAFLETGFATKTWDYQEACLGFE